MSSNRIRPQFSSLSFNFGDPLKLDLDLPSSPALGRLDRAVASGLADRAAQTASHVFPGLDSPLAGHMSIASLAAGSGALHQYAAAAVGQALVGPGHDHSVELNRSSGFTIDGAARHAYDAAPTLAQAGIRGSHYQTQSDDPVGQLWAAFGGPGTGNPDGHSDWRIEHADSDGLGTSSSPVIQQQQSPTGGYVAIGLDTTANLSITLDNTFHLRITNLTTGVDLTNTVIASTADFDVVNAFAVNAQTNTIYADLFGYDYLTHGGDIIKITYNQTTGAIANPYTFNDGLGTGSVDPNFILIDSASTSGATKYADGRAFFLSADGSTLYYVDDNDNDPGGFWGFSTNAILKVSTSGDVGHGTSPTPVLLSSQIQFPTNDSAGFITGITVSEAKGIIYFTTNGSAEGVNTSQDAIWWMPITGGTATKMTIPAGVSVSFPVFFGNALAIDVANQQLYYSDKQTGQIVEFTLSADGHSFSSASNFAKFDTAGGSAGDGGFASQTVFDDLPQLGSLTGTTTDVVQGGSAVTLLTATPTMVDPDGFDLRGGTVTITDAQAGDVLSANTAGTSITASYNSVTHVLTFSGEDTYAHYQQVFNSVQYQDSGTDNSTGSHPTRTLTWIISDGITVGSPSTSDPNERQTTVTIDRAPTLGLDGYNVAEGGSTSGTSGLAGTGVFGNDNDKDGDVFTMTAVNGLLANIGTQIAGTYGHLTLNADGSFGYNADNIAAIDSAASGSHPQDDFTYTVSDGLGGVSTQTVSFSVDRPATAFADAIATNENASATAATKAAGLLGNDVDVDTNDNTGIVVTAVNGVGASVGNQIVLASGALLTVNADGTYTYDPNHQFDYLPAAASGAPSTATDSFTYTIAGGSTVTATITIHGVDSDDTLQGSVGNDTFDGGIGNDLFSMQDGGNDAVTGGSGDDKFAFGSSLTAADTIDGGTGSDRLVLSGDYSAGVTLGASTLVNVETLRVLAGNDYTLTSNDATVASGALLTVDAHTLGSGDSLNFDGSAESDGQFRFFDGAGNDSLTGGMGNDLFVMHGGNDDVKGGGGDDLIFFGSSLTATDTIDGGTGSDTLLLKGDYSAGVTLGASTLVNVEVLRVLAGSDYTLTSNDATVASGAVLIVGARSLGSGDSLNFDGSAESDGQFTFFDGAGNDSLTGGMGNDIFSLNGGNDDVKGGGGDDKFFFGASLTAADTIDGGTGSDTLVLSGDYSAGVTLGASTLVNVEILRLQSGSDYTLTSNDATVASGALLIVDAHTLGSGDDVSFDGAAESDGRFRIITGGGNDHLIGGAGIDQIDGGSGANIFTGGGGGDQLHAGSGADTFVYGAASDSTSTNYDTIFAFDADADHLDIPGSVNAIDAAVTSGTLRGAHFDSDLAASIGAGQLAAGDAVLFTPNGGNLAGSTFLVVDLGGGAGYQANLDLVIKLDTATGTLDTGDFV